MKPRVKLAAEPWIERCRRGARVSVAVLCVDGPQVERKDPAVCSARDGRETPGGTVFRDGWRVFCVARVSRERTCFHQREGVRLVEVDAPVFRVHVQRAAPAAAQENDLVDGLGFGRAALAREVTHECRPCVAALGEVVPALHAAAKAFRRAPGIARERVADHWIRVNETGSTFFFSAVLFYYCSQAKDIMPKISRTNRRGNTQARAWWHGNRAPGRRAGSAAAQQQPATSERFWWLFQQQHQQHQQPDPQAKPEPEPELEPEPAPAPKLAAVVIGIEYTRYARTGRAERLPGCHRDTDTAQTILNQYFGFQRGVDSVQVLRDDTTRSTRDAPHPTLYNIKRALTKAVRFAQEHKDTVEDVVVFYSGHGTSTRDHSRDEEDGLDEALVPSDYLDKGLLRDDQLLEIFKDVPATVRVRCVLDCCHSGTGVDFGSEGARTSLQTQDALSLSGCRDDQTSASAYDLENRRKWQGAMTWALHKVLVEEREGGDDDPRRENAQRVHARCTQLLKERAFEQRPVIDTNHAQPASAVF